MPDCIVKEDLRSIKTEKALDIAMHSLLESQSFRKITVKNLCDAALISRATFYTHFMDKYHLLKDWIVCLRPDSIDLNKSYEEREEVINQFIYRNQAIIKNLVYDADDETLEILFSAILSILDLPVEKPEIRSMDTKHVVLSNFYAGGILQYLLWQVRNRFPTEVAPMNIYFNEIIVKFQDWKTMS